MLKTYSVLFFFFLSASFGYGQTKEIDSLKNIVARSKINKAKASAYQRLSWLTFRKDLALGEVYLDSAATLYKADRNEEELLKLNYKYAVLSRYKGEYEKGLQQIDLFLKHMKINGAPIQMADAYSEKGVLYQLQGKYEKSLTQYYSAQKIYEETADENSIGLTLNRMGIVHRKLKQYKEAEKCFLKAITIHKNANDEDNLANALSSLGSNYGEQGLDEKAIFYFKECLVLDIKADNQWAIASDYQNIGIGYMNLDQYEDGIRYLKKAIKIQEKQGFKGDMAFALMALGSSYVKTNELVEAENTFLKALDLGIDAAQTRKDIYKNLAEIYKRTNRYKKSNHYYERYVLEKDSIFKEEGLKNMNALKIQYETEKKDKEIAQQKLALTNSKSKTRTMTILIISLLLGSILLWFSFSQRQKRMQQQLVAIEREQEVRTLESLMEGEEKERLRIAKELHDGVNGDLAAIKFKLTSLLETNNTIINEAVAMIDTSSEQVRAISHNLVPPSLRDFNLIEAVATYCENMNAIHDPDISFQHMGNEILLEKKEEANLFRIIQELVTNSIKHAEASEILVQLSNVENHLQITVEDDGKGFDVKNVQSDGIGMQNIKSRVAYLGGVMEITSDAKGSSFTITLTDKTDTA